MRSRMVCAVYLSLPLSHSQSHNLSVCECMCACACVRYVDGWVGGGGGGGGGFSVRGTEEKPTRVLGISGHQWSEVVRTDDQMECMMWPRMVRAVYLCIWCVCVSVRE